MPDPPFHPDAEGSRILSAIVDSSDDAIIGKDLDGAILSWNRGAERLYGYTAAEIAGRSIAILIPESQADELANILGRLKAGERVEPYETVRRARDGPLAGVSLSASPIRDAHGHTSAPPRSRGILPSADARSERSA